MKALLAKSDSFLVNLRSSDADLALNSYLIATVIGPIFFQYCQPAQISISFPLKLLPAQLLYNDFAVDFSHFSCIIIYLQLV